MYTKLKLIPEIFNLVTFIRFIYITMLAYADTVIINSHNLTFDLWYVHIIWGKPLDIRVVKGWKFLFSFLNSEPYLKAGTQTLNIITKQYNVLVRDDLNYILYKFPCYNITQYWGAIIYGFKFAIYLYMYFQYLVSVYICTITNTAFSWYILDLIYLLHAINMKPGSINMSICQKQTLQNILRHSELPTPETITQSWITF
jgi:hypothetical protein